MDKKQFTQKVASPTRFTSQERGWLKAMSDKHPYSSVVRLISLAADHAYGFDTPEEHRAVTLAVCPGCDIDTLLNASKPQVADDPDFDIFHEINTYQEISFKTAPKSVILSNFLETASLDKQKSAGNTPAPSVASDKKSLAPDESLGTETLAIILENQGKYQESLAIYKKLLAANPEKNSTFAPRIERLNNLINNKDN